MDDLNRRVDDMDRIVTRLDAQTRDHEGLYQEYIKMGTSLPSPSAFRKQGGSIPTSITMPSPVRVPPQPVDVPVEAAPDMASRQVIRSNSPPQSSTPTVHSGNRTPQDLPRPMPPAIHIPVEETHSMSAKGRLRRASTMGMVVPEEPHARFGHSDASSEASKSVAEEF